jgi:hypothetical protein
LERAAGRRFFGGSGWQATRALDAPNIFPLGRKPLLIGVAVRAAICGPDRVGMLANAVPCCCTTRFKNAHGTVFRELLYHWHPWFGMRVAIHEAVDKADSATNASLHLSIMVGLSIGARKNSL